MDLEISSEIPLLNAEIPEFFQGVQEEEDLLAVFNNCSKIG